MVVLRDGIQVKIRPLRKEDEELLVKFFKNLDVSDVMFLMDDVRNEEVVREWVRGLDYNWVLPLVAVHNAEIVGDIALKFSGRERRKHVAELTVTIARDFRGKGLGAALNEAAEDIARQKGIRKLKYETPISNVRAVISAELWGYTKEAVLEKEFYSPVDKLLHDVVVLTKFIQPVEVEETPEVIEEFL